MALFLEILYEFVRAATVVVIDVKNHGAVFEAFSHGSKVNETLTVICNRLNTMLRDTFFPVAAVDEVNDIDMLLMCTEDGRYAVSIDRDSKPQLKCRCGCTSRIPAIRLITRQTPPPAC